jgi:uncharacterized protein
MRIYIKSWQIAVLVAPIVAIGVFLLVAAGQQIREWHLNWIWAVVVFVLLGWRWLLVRWTRPAFAQAEALVSEVSAELEAASEGADVPNVADGQGQQAQVEAALRQVLALSQEDPPVWEDWPLFWQRCLGLVTAIAKIYYPEVKRPLLNIYVPQAYGLIRGTVDDTDRMMQKLSPVLNQVSIAQMIEGVEVYRKLEPSAKKLIKVFNWAQWVLNPAAAIARQTSAKYLNQANQQILLNFSNLLRETALRNLAQQSAALYGQGGKGVVLSPVAPSLATPVIDEATDQAKTPAKSLAQIPAKTAAKTQSLADILERAEPTDKLSDSLQRSPVSILLVGRTGAGKSSVINTLFRSDLAAVDVLPSTDALKSYRWQSASLSADEPAGGPLGGSSGDSADALVLWDTPGYEQVNRSDLREQVMAEAVKADLLLLVTPALDPALQVDADFLQDVLAQQSDMPVIVAVTQVDKLRPVREWSPPYNWRTGAWPKEVAIREAVSYRVEQFGDRCTQVLPLVNQTTQPGYERTAWGEDELAAALLGAIAPAKQLRLARFFRSRQARIHAAAQIIDRYSFQMSTTEGLAKLLKSPILQFLSTLTTGSPALGAILTEKIPVEEVPLVLGKLQIAYELFALLSETSGWQAAGAAGFDLLALWPLLMKKSDSVGTLGHHSAEKQAWAWGQALMEYWTQSIELGQVESRIAFYLETANP